MNAEVVMSIEAIQWLDRLVGAMAACVVIVFVSSLIALWRAYRGGDRR